MFRKYLFTLILFLQACNNPMNAEIGHDKSIEGIIQEYLLLELSMGIHHQDHVDAYYGPEDIKKVIHYAQLILELTYGIKKTKEK